MENMKSLSQIQNEIHAWSTENFGPMHNQQIALRISSFLGMVEELGELAHAILKMSQGIRGTVEEHMAKVKDSLADLLVFTLDFAARNNMDAEQLLNDVWAEVQKRNWKKDPVTGGTNDKL